MKGLYPVRSSLALSLVLGFAGALAASAANAVTPGAQTQTLEVSAVSRPVRADAGLPAAHAMNQTESWLGFLERNPGFTATWKTGSPVPHRIYGTGRAPAAAPSRPVEAEALAARFLGSEAKAWVRSEDLRAVRSVEDGGGWWVQYAQQHEGVRVVDGKVTVRLDRRGRVVSSGIGVSTGSFGPAVPRLDTSEAWREALSGFEGANLEPGEVEVVYLPVQGGAGVTHRLAYEMRFASWDPAGAWVAYVDAVDGRLLSRENHIRFADVNGTTTGRIETLSSGGPTAIVPMPYLEMVLRDTTNSTVVASDTTGVDGSYLLSPSSNGTQRLELPLSGPFGRIFHGALIPDLYDLDPALTPVPSLLADTETGGVVNPVLDDANSVMADRNAFYWAMLSHDYIQAVDPSFTVMDYPMPIVTDVPNNQCNAFWNGLGITFYPSGGGCANTARSPSVVIHEYGHGITDLQYRPFAPSGAMHEGFSDYLSATMLNDPRIAVGWGGPGTVLRSVANSLRTPEHLVGESHADGLIIAGALWDARTFLGAALVDSLWHYARYGLSDNFHDYYFDFLLVDDDDGNVYNGTPHFNQIRSAFDRHGIGDYSIHVVHLPVKDTENTSASITITASFLSLVPVEEDSVLVHVAVNGGAVETHVMSPTGGVREYEYALGTQTEGTEVAYWFTAVDEEGRTVASPPAAEAGPYAFRVGTDSTPPVIVHTPLVDQPVGVDALRVTAAVTDNLTGGLGSVTVTHAQNAGEAVVTPMDSLGGGVYETLLPFGSLSVGDVFSYRIDAVDVAGQPNQAASPENGMDAFTVVRGIGSDFENTDGGFSGEGVWEWGVPGLGVTAHTGTKVWATDLDFSYPSSVEQALTVGPVDLTEFSRAQLSFWHLYDFEDVFDGATVLASSDGGTTWDVLTPAGGYPTSALSNTLPGYSGKHLEWEHAVFDLSPFLGEPDTRFRLQFVSDLGLSQLGWYVDDLQVVERQLLDIPSRVWATSGRDSQVPVFWKPPLVVSEDSPNSPITGYNVYRSSDAGATYELQNDELLTERAFIDDDVVNGTAYLYTVTAVYGEEESPFSTSASALPYLAVYQAEDDSVHVSVFEGESLLDTVTVTNAGSGFLKLNAWAAPEGVPIDDVRVRFPLSPGPVPAAPRGRVAGTPPTGSYTLLIEDAKDSFGPVNFPDLKTLQAQADETSLYLKVTAHLNWGNINEHFIIAVAIDVDGDLVDDDNPGDFILVAGAGAAPLGVDAVILDSETLAPVAFPHFVNQAASVDSAEWGIFLEDIESPENVYLAAAVLNLNQITFDRTPNKVFIKWLEGYRTNLSIPAGESADIPFSVEDKDGVGTYNATFFVETNDPTHDSFEVPITFEVKETVPVRLLSLAGSASPGGIVLEWEVAEATSHAGFHVYRSEAPNGLETRLTEALLPPNADGSHRFTDTGVTEGGDYLYRIADVSRDGRATFHGPVLVRYDASLALTRPVLFQNTPNPVRSGTMIRFGLPEAGPVSVKVYTMTGRLVRRLADREVYAAGFHEIAWDGVDEAGRRVAGGIYTYRMEVPGRVLHRKLAVLR